MRTAQLTKSISVLTLALLAMVATIVPANASGMCSDRTVQGLYPGFWTSLYLNGPPPRSPHPIKDFTPFTINQVSNFDGQGHFVTNGTLSDGGTVGQPFTLHGTYNVNQNCTGHVTIPATGAGYDLIILHDGAVLNFIETDGPIAVFTFTRLEER
jgi:hypothetical protein